MRTHAPAEGGPGVLVVLVVPSVVGARFWSTADANGGPWRGMAAVLARLVALGVLGVLGAEACRGGSTRAE